MSRLKQLWCGLTGHRGLTPSRFAALSTGENLGWRCKACGQMVRLP